MSNTEEQRNICKFIEEALSVVSSDEHHYYSLSDDDDDLLSLSSDMESVEDEDDDDECLQTRSPLQESKKDDREYTILETDSLHAARRRVLPAKILTDDADEDCCIEDGFAEEEYEMPLKGSQHDDDLPDLSSKKDVTPTTPAIAEPPQDLKVQTPGKDYAVEHTTSQKTIPRTLLLSLVQ